MADPKKKNTGVLLELSTIAPDPQFVTINDSNYELLPMAQMGVKEQIRIGRLSSKAGEIRGIEDLTDEAVQELIDTYETILKGIMPTLPKEVSKTLRPSQVEQILVVFTELSGIVIPQAEAVATDQ